MVAALIIVAGPLKAVPVGADQMTPRSLTLSSNIAGDQNVSYRAQFTIATSSLIGSIDILLCSDTPLLDQPCTPPVGLNTSSAQLTSALGQTGFSLSTTTPPNELLLTRAPLIAFAGQTVSYDFSKIANPTNPGPLFARFLTYASSDASGTPVDAGGLALYIANSLDVNAEVPPFLLFCLGENITAFDCSTATEPFSDMSDLSSSTTAAAQHQVLIATNAGNGYSMWVTGTSMQSGNDVITPMSGGTSQKGTSQFGINLRANTAPHIGSDATGPGVANPVAAYNQPDHFRFQSGDTIAGAAAPSDFRKFTISYIVNVPAGQPGGVYSTTLTYICLANF